MMTDIDVEPCFFMSEGEPVGAFLYQPVSGRNHPAVVLSPPRLRTGNEYTP